MSEEKKIVICSEITLIEAHIASNAIKTIFAECTILASTTPGERALRLDKGFSLKNIPQLKDVIKQCPALKNFDILWRITTE